MLVLCVRKVRWKEAGIGIKKRKIFLGTSENLLGRANQQVTCSFRKKDQGTSETTREAVSINAQSNNNSANNFDFSGYEPYKPQQIKHLDTKFLTWFIGFVEGDGSFWSRDANISTNQSRFIFDPKFKRGEFEIIQHIDNIKLLYYIHTKLGFGQVTTIMKYVWSILHIKTRKHRWTHLYF